MCQPSKRTALDDDEDAIICQLSASRWCVQLLQPLRLMAMMQLLQQTMLAFVSHLVCCVWDTKPATSLYSWCDYGWWWSRRPVSANNVRESFNIRSVHCSAV